MGPTVTAAHVHKSTKNPTPTHTHEHTHTHTSLPLASGSRRFGGVEREMLTRTSTQCAVRNCRPLPHGLPALGKHVPKGLVTKTYGISIANGGLKPVLTSTPTAGDAALTL
jgi:hypothetical protein